MALRRALLKVATLAATLLALLPAAVMAAPRWLGAEPLDTVGTSAGAPDVASDSGGNSAAVWSVNSNEIRAAVRPRGGPWGAPQTLETGVSNDDPLIVARPDGAFVAVWVDGRNEIRWAQRTAGGDWSDPATIASDAGCCPNLEALEEGADNSVALIWTIDGPTQSSTRIADGAWGTPQALPGGGNGLSLAKAPDGSAVVAYTESCSETSSPCVHATYRPRNGDWSGPELAGGSFDISGVAVAARSDSSYTVVWGERPQAGLVRGGSLLVPSVRSADRPAGATGVWSPPQTIAEPPGGAAGCPQPNFGCVDLAAASDDTLVAVWQQDDGNPDQPDQIAAALRPDGDTWDPAETIESVFSNDALPKAAFTGNGIPVAVWRDQSGGPGASIRGAHRDADTGWFPEPLSNVATQDVSIDFRSVAGDGEGNAVTGWRDQDGVATAGFDGVGPRIDAFSVPGAGTVGEGLAFSAVADDNWSGVTGISWLFGDDGTADGATVSHSYGTAGSFAATATATDGSGNQSQGTGTTAVAAAVTPTPTPTPDPCGTADKDKDGIKDGCDTNDGSSRPVAFKTVNATVVSGDVFVKLPAGAARAAQAKAPKGFVRLQGAETIPVGSTLDTAKGRVRLRTASDTRKHVQTADFFRGRFVVRQVRKPRGKARKRSTKLITELRLNGSSFSKACRAGKASISAKRSKKRVRRLFGDGKGSFRTRGRNAAATVRGTRWGVQDRCDGTLVAVQRGRVEVRDLVKHKTVFVRAGHTYLAKRR